MSSAALLSLWLLASCEAPSGDPPEQDGSAGPKADEADTDAEAPMEPALPGGVQWGSSCSLGEHCADIEVPLIHAEPDGTTIEVRVGLHSAITTPARGQLWMLQGGPGGDGAALSSTAADLAAQLDLDVFILQHRGVEGSTALWCPEENAAWPVGERDVRTCRDFNLDEYGEDGLAAFSTTEAALDLDLVIEATRREDQPVFTYGVSYGSYWLLRFLDVHQSQVDGAILDGLASPGELYLTERIDKNDRVLRRLAEACVEDPTCREHLSDDPWGVLTEVFDALETGSCAGGVASVHDAASLVEELMTRQQFALVWPVIHRLRRCDADDQAALQILQTVLDPPSARPWASLLYYNVALSELWAPPGESEYQQHCDGGIVCDPRQSTATSWFVDHWPRYEEDRVGRWPQTDVPVLVLAGDYDVQTPIEEASAILGRDELDTVHFVEVSRTGHGVIIDAPICATEIIGGFVENSAVEPGPCEDNLHRSMEPDPEAAMRFLGVADPWDGATDRTIVRGRNRRPFIRVPSL